MTPDQAIRKTIGTQNSRKNLYALHKAQGKPAPKLSRKGKKGLEADLARIPSDLREGLQKSVENITWAEAQRRAQKLAAEGHIDNPRRFGAWLFWVGKVQK